MAADIDNVKIGVCSVKFNNVDLGHTKGGVTVSYAPELHEVTVDKYGNTPVDEVLIGEKFVVRAPLAESTLANIQVAIPEGTTSGTKVTIGTDAGQSMAADAKELVLHPIANESDDLSEDVVIYKALVTNTIEIPFLFDGEKVLEVEFTALLDESKSNRNRLGLIGDSTA